jgi:hypothetical protein
VSWRLYKNCMVGDGVAKMMLKIFCSIFSFGWSVRIWKACSYVRRLLVQRRVSLVLNRLSMQKVVKLLVVAILMPECVREKRNYFCVDKNRYMNKKYVIPLHLF